VSEIVDAYHLYDEQQAREPQRGPGPRGRR
jgi:hypothetical protein